MLIICTVGQKTLFLRVDNFAMAYGRKVYDMSKVLEFYPEKKCKNCMSVQINILRLICINLHYTSIYAEFDRNTWILLRLQLEHAVKVTAMIIYLHTELVETKLNIMCTTLCLDNHHQSSWQLTDRSVQCVLA